MVLREGVLRSDRFTEKERRNLAILDIIRRAREVSRAEISRITHLNIVTISNYVDDYVSKGLVVEKGLDVSTGGRRPELLELNSKYGYTVGVDLGAPQITEDSYMMAVMIDVHGKIVSKARMQKGDDTQHELIDKALALVGDVMAKSKVPKEKIRGVGIGIWGVLDRYKGTVRYAVEKGGIFSYADLQAAIERKYELSSIVEHDAAAGAIGEKWIGLGLETEAENILYICSDSSLGLIINNELYYGSSKSAGELNVNPPGDAANDEQCWSKYDYGCCLRSRGIDLGITPRAKAFFQSKSNVSSKIMELAKGDVSKITFTMIIEAAKSQDELAKKFLIDAGEYLGAKIAFLINLFNPDAVVIGRGVERAGDIFMDAVRKSIRKWAYEESLKVARVVPTSLGEDSVACGAAVLVMQQVFAKV